MLNSSQTGRPGQETPDLGSWPRVVIITVNWNGWRDTIKCLKSVQGLTYANYLTVVVDNGSLNDSIEKIGDWARSNLGEGQVFVEYTKALAEKGGEEHREEALERVLPTSRMVLIRNEENLGFQGGNNVAIHYALRRAYPADYVFLLNPDATVEKDCLKNLFLVSRKSGAAIVGAVHMNETGEQIEFRGRISFLSEFFYPFLRYQRPPPPGPPEFWTSFRVGFAAALIKEEALQAIHSQKGRYLDPDLFISCDELEFCFVARRAGYKSVVARDAVAYHKGGSSFGGRYSPIPYYYWTRNRVLLANRLLPLRYKAFFHLIYSPICLVRMIRRLTSRQAELSRAIWCGLIDGYRGVTGEWVEHDKRIPKKG